MMIPVVSFLIDNYWLTTGGVVIIPHQFSSIAGLVITPHQFYLHIFIHNVAEEMGRVIILISTLIAFVVYL
jgi:hypothetical protein